MNVSMVIVGLIKAGFGIVVGALLIFVASRAIHRLLGMGAVDESQREGNVAVGILTAGSLVAVGIMLRHAVIATFSAADLLYRDADFSTAALAHVAMYAAIHLTLSTVLSALVLAFGTGVFSRLTRGVDELKEIREGNIAPALVLAAVMVVLALLAAPGLQMALDGLLPLPELGRDLMVTPH